MPLPPAPTKPADIVAPESYGKAATASRRRTKKKAAALVAAPLEETAVNEAAATEAATPVKAPKAKTKTTTKATKSTAKSTPKATKAAKTTKPETAPAAVEAEAPAKSQTTTRKTEKKAAEKKAAEKPLEAKAASSKKRTGKAAAPASAADQTSEPNISIIPGASRLRKPRSSASSLKPRVFVLDTNVLLHDPTCLFRFQEHDVFLPMTTLEELDNHKTGTSDLARNARQVSRTIDQLIEAGTDSIDKGVKLDVLGNREAHGRLYFETSAVSAALPAGLDQDKADNKILAVVNAIGPKFPDKNIVLVSKDINMRIKATALGLAAEDYFNDKTIDDTDLLYTGRTVVSPDFWEKEVENLKSWQSDGRTWYSFEGPLASRLTVNEFVTASDGSFVAQVKSKSAGTVVLATLKDYMQPRNPVWGVHARNIEQSLALNLLMDPDIDFVTLLGQAGTGKTLITLAAALTQTLDERRFTEIIFTRATVSVGEEIGFLPGTEEEKMTPWMGALEDNLEVLNKSDRATGDWGRSAAADLIRSRIRIKSMSFMRGRTFLNKFVIIDEAQNLSPKQMKTLITRAGPGTKIVCMGNIAQIDTPYLTEGSSGLTYVVDRFRGWEHAGHITLQRGERSRLADYASEVL